MENSKTLLQAISFSKPSSLSASFSVQIKATEQYFPVVLFIMLYKVVLTFESVGKILNCDHSNESY